MRIFLSSFGKTIAVNLIAQGLPKKRRADNSYKKPKYSRRSQIEHVRIAKVMNMSVG